jgi:hypothetical protein
METLEELNKSTIPTSVFARVVPHVFGLAIIQICSNVGGLLRIRSDNESSTTRVDLVSVKFTLQKISICTAVDT